MLKNNSPSVEIFHERELPSFHSALLHQWKYYVINTIISAESSFTYWLRSRSPSRRNRSINRYYHKAFHWSTSLEIQFLFSFLMMILPMVYLLILLIFIILTLPLKKWSFQLLKEYYEIFSSSHLNRLLS